MNIGGSANLTLTGTVAGTGALTVGGAATLDSSSPLASLANAVVLNAALSIGGTQDLTLGGVISGTGQLIKNGAANLTKDGFGDLTLSGTNTFTGALNIASGSVTTVSSGALGNTSGANISAGANLYLNSNTSTFDGDLGGSGGLTKVGTGTLNLTGINGLTGNTNVNGGTLNLTGALASTQLNPRQHLATGAGQRC